MNKYEKQGTDFLKSTGTELKATFLKNDYHFVDDKDKRDIYKITLKRGDREYKFNFGQSLNNSNKFKINYGKLGKTKILVKPTTYDILSCLQTDDLVDFKDFCDNFGYSDDSIKAEKIYRAVLNEYENLKMLYSDEELLKISEIQ